MDNLKLLHISNMDYDIAIGSGQLENIKQLFISVTTIGINWINLERRVIYRVTQLK